MVSYAVKHLYKLVVAHGMANKGCSNPRTSVYQSRHLLLYLAPFLQYKHKHKVVLLIE
jgi:hypothetical protein